MIDLVINIVIKDFRFIPVSGFRGDYLLIIIYIQVSIALNSGISPNQCLQEKHP